MPLFVSLPGGSSYDLPIAGDEYVLTYVTRINGQRTDLPSGGQVISVTLTPAAGGLPTVINGPANRTDVGTYVFPAAVMPSAGDYIATTIYTLGTGGAQHADSGEVFRVYAFSGGGMGSVLATLAQVKAGMNIPDTDTAHDEEIQLKIDTATAMIIDRCCQLLPAPFVETAYPDGAVIVCKHYPLLAVTSVTEYAGASPTTLTASTSPADVTAASYAVDLNAGIIRRLSTYGPTSFAAAVQITGTAGPATVDVRATDACIELTRFLYSPQRGPLARGPMAPVEAMPNSRPGYGMPNFVMDILGDLVRAPQVG